MLWPGGFLAIDLATSTPDALCPPLAEARAAVQARVGEVRGDYRAEFALVRASDGRQVLELVMHRGSEQVLRRELPLDEAGCLDAAQAIALVLERYFDTIESPAPGPPDPRLESVPVTREPAPRQVASTPRPPAVSAPAPSRSGRAWRARAAFVYDSQLRFAPRVGVALHPEGWRLSSRLRLGLALETTAFLQSWTERVREERVSASTLEATFSVPLHAQLQPWRLSIGPMAQLRFQRAEAPSLSRERSAYRAVPGFGGFAELAWSPAPGWTIGLGAVLGGQLASAAPRFALRLDSGEAAAVLVPASAFGQGFMSLEVEL